MTGAVKEWNETRCQLKLQQRLKTKHMEVICQAQELSSNQLVTQRYNLRPRENLNVPARFLDD